MGQTPGRVLVRRAGVWEEHSTEELYPGDIISLKRRGGEEIPVPCDCVLLQAGSAVVNEASLTEESVPQMKEHINPEVSKDEGLDMNGLHKVHVLYSGTTLMQHTAKTDASHPPPQVSTPDDGCLCYVLQTGFASTQGKLMRMMEFSSEQVTGDTKETLILLFILLVFARRELQCVDPATSGWKEKSVRTHFAMHHDHHERRPSRFTHANGDGCEHGTHRSGSYIGLLHGAIPSPVAGKIDSCLFDKTGTITSDRLVAEGVLSDLSKNAELKQPVEASKNVSIVVGGCHALLEIDGKMFGDPLEKAALLGIKWKYDPTSHTASPKMDDEIKRTWDGVNKTSVKILARNHFASALQRMSVVADDEGGLRVERWSLVKGSPEMIKTLLRTVPQGYDAAYRSLAEQGMRVIALAHKPLDETESARVGSQTSPFTRDEAESDLVFDGFFAFACKVRADSAEIIHALKSSSNNVMMATGDATLTALQRRAMSA